MASSDDEDYYLDCEIYDALALHRVEVRRRLVRTTRKVGMLLRVPVRPFVDYSKPGLLQLTHSAVLFLSRNKKKDALEIPLVNIKSVEDTNPVRNGEQENTLQIVYEIKPENEAGVGGIVIEYFKVGNSASMWETIRKIRHHCLFSNDYILLRPRYHDGVWDTVTSKTPHFTCCKEYNIGHGGCKDSTLSKAEISEIRQRGASNQTHDYYSLIPKSDQPTSNASRSQNIRNGMHVERALPNISEVEYTSVENDNSNIPRHSTPVGLPKLPPPRYRMQVARSLPSIPGDDYEDVEEHHEGLCNIPARCLKPLPKLPSSTPPPDALALSMTAFVLNDVDTKDDNVPHLDNDKPIVEPGEVDIPCIGALVLIHENEERETRIKEFAETASSTNFHDTDLKQPIGSEWTNLCWNNDTSVSKTDADTDKQCRQPNEMILEHLNGENPTMENDLNNSGSVEPSQGDGFAANLVSKTTCSSNGIRYKKVHKEELSNKADRGTSHQSQIKTSKKYSNGSNENSLSVRDTHSDNDLSPSLNLNITGDLDAEVYRKELSHINVEIVSGKGSIYNDSSHESITSWLAAQTNQFYIPEEIQEDSVYSYAYKCDMPMSSLTPEISSMSCRDVTESLAERDSFSFPENNGQATDSSKYARENKKTEKSGQKQATFTVPEGCSSGQHKWRCENCYKPIDTNDFEEKRNYGEGGRARSAPSEASTNHGSHTRYTRSTNQRDPNGFYVTISNGQQNVVSFKIHGNSSTSDLEHCYEEPDAYNAELYEYCRPRSSRSASRHQAPAESGSRPPSALRRHNAAREA